MKLVWCPDTASKAYIDAIKLLSATASTSSSSENEVAEVISAMAGGWRAQSIVEAWGPKSDGVSTSLGLSAAARRTGGRHVCIVPDSSSKSDYLASIGGAAAVEVLVGEPEAAMGEIPWVDFLLVDLRRRDAVRVLKAARLGPRGAVVVCIEAGHMGVGGAGAEERWKGVLMEGSRVVRCAFLPIGRGVEIVHVGVGEGKRLGDLKQSRWIKHVDRITGEEHLFRR